MKLARLFWLIVILFVPTTTCAETKEVDWSDRSPEYWQERLTRQEFAVCRQGGTEPAYSGDYANYKGEGTFVCSSCGQRLFDASTKFDSGTGWPSFYKPVTKDVVELKEDPSFGMSRTEVLCSRCGAHLGHVFEDGPQPTGKRYCINSICLDLEKDIGLQPSHSDQ